jgi:hypothetical protein
MTGIGWPNAISYDRYKHSIRDNQTRPKSPNRTATEPEFLWQVAWFWTTRYMQRQHAFHFFKATPLAPPAFAAACKSAHRRPVNLRSLRRSASRGNLSKADKHPTLNWAARL